MYTHIKHRNVFYSCLCNIRKKGLGHINQNHKGQFVSSLRESYEIRSIT